MNKKWYLHIITVMSFVVFSVMALGSGTTEKAVQSDSSSTTRTQSLQQTESDVGRFRRLYQADQEKMVVGSDNITTIESIEAVFQPQIITGIDEITDAKLSAPGRPYYFKLRAIYKGYDARAERFILQDLGTQSGVGDAAWGAAFGIDTNVYPLRSLLHSSWHPTDANSVATFYIIAVRFTSDDKGWRGNDIQIYVRYIREVEKPAHDPAKFIVANRMHYITVNDAHVTTQEDVMAAYFLGSAATNTSNIFDPIGYPLLDLMDARVEMNKKDIFNDYTFPTVQVKFVSEVIFRGQTNTTITVSTVDNILTERMNFTGRASSVGNSERIRVYYTIAKERVSRFSNEALEKWEIQAIERL